MKQLLIVGTLCLSVHCHAQDVVVYLNGNATPAKVKATSEATLFTDKGNFNFVDIDSIETTDPGVRAKFEKRQSPKVLYKSMNALYVDGLPINEAGKIVFTDVVTVDSASKNKLYLNSKQFFAETFKSANDVIQLDDKESGTVIGKGFSEIYVATGFSPVATRLYYTIKIQSRDGRYKYSIEDFTTKSYPTQYSSSSEFAAEAWLVKETYFKKNGQPRVTNSSYRDNFLQVGLGLVLTIKKSMSANTTEKDDDW